MIKPYYQDKWATIYHGDCNMVIKSIQDKSVDLVLTDPPYNIGYKYDFYKDSLPNTDYLNWQLDLLKSIERILKRNGSLFYLNYPEFNCEIYTELKRNFILVPIDIITWVYNSHFTNGINLRKGSRTWIWASKGQPLNNFKSEYKNDSDKRIQKKKLNNKFPKEFDWWLIEQVKNVSKEKTTHPCQLPMLMIEKIIEGTTNKNDLVFDPFLGSGTTLVVSKKLGRRGIGCDISEKYCEIAAKRISLSTFYKQHPTKAKNGEGGLFP